MSLQKNTNDGVSPLVAVILMITLVIILAALISQFTLELGGILEQPIQAGVDFDSEYDVSQDSYTVTVTWSSSGTADTIHIQEPDGSTTPEISEVGDSIEVINLDEGDTIQVIGTHEDGHSSIIQSYDVD